MLPRGQAEVLYGCVQVEEALLIVQAQGQSIPAELFSFS